MALWKWIISLTLSPLPIRYPPRTEWEQSPHSRSIHESYRLTPLSLVTWTGEGSRDGGEKRRSEVQLRGGVVYYIRK